MPKYSFIMPIKDREELMIDSVESILAQTYSNWELIIVDDCSKDNTLKIASDYEARDSRVKVISLEKNLGPAGARNEGIKYTCGEFLVFSDSDDISEKTRLQEINKALVSRPDIDIIYHLMKRKFLDGETENVPHHEFDQEFLKVFDYIPNPCVSIRKTAFDATGGYDPNLRTAEDYDMLLCALEHGYNFHLLEKYLTIQKIHGGNITTNLSIERRKSDLRYVRIKHKIKTYSLEEAEKMCKDKKYWDFINTDFIRNIWFSS